MNSSMRCKAGRRLLHQIPASSLALALSVVLLALGSVPGYAQENTGAIQGVVKDQNSAAIPGARVVASSPTLVRPLEAACDSTGAYRFPKLPVGVYTITVSQSGFKTTKSENINLLLGSELRLDVTLPTGNVSEAVVVSAAAEAIDVTSSKTAANLTERFIENTPKGRTFNTLLQAAPGVLFDTLAGSSPSGGSTATGTSGNAPGGGVGGFSVNGASGSENAFIVDGVEVSNIRNGALGRQNAVPFEFVREVQVKSGGFEAEYGGAIGGVINVITKSGSNDFHGEGAFLFNGSALNSRPRGFWQLDATDSGKAQYLRPKEDTYQSLFPGFSLGGPLLKDRLNFFSSYYPELFRSERSINYVGGARTTTTHVLRQQALARLDFAPTQKIQANTSFIWTPIRLTGIQAGVDPAVTPPNDDFSNKGGYVPAKSYTASFTYTPTAKLILSARYGYNYVNDKGNTYGLPGSSLITYLRPTSGPSYSGPEVPAQFAGVSGFQNIPNNFTVNYDTLTRHNLYLDGSYVARLFGQQHAFKGGYALNHMANYVDDNYPSGFFRIFWGTAYSRGSIQNVRGAYGYYMMRDGIRHNKAGASSRNQAFYVQDAWQVTPHVTLNLGVRFENEFLPPFTKTVNGVKVANPISFGWGDKISPRLGGAWDVLGTGKWKLSASFGYFYDLMKYELARSSFGGDYWHDLIYKLDNPDLTKLSKQNPGALGALIQDLDNRTVPINAQGVLDGIDPNIKPMLSRQFNVTTEHRLAGNLILSARYTRQRLVRGIEDIGSLDAQENEVFVIGNPGFSQASDQVKSPSGAPFTPKAVRNYDGLEFRFDQRFSNGMLRNLTYSASYTYSRLYGNWAGLSNSDELGRSQPNVSRAFDGPPVNFDSKGHNVIGLLATDRPHVFKFFGNYQYKWRGGTSTFALSQFAFSGTPLSSTVTYTNLPIFYNGRGDLGRTPVLTQTDLLLAHNFAVTERVKIRVDMNVTNLFNQAAVTNANTALNRNENILLTEAQFYAGFDATKLVFPNGINPATGKAFPTPNLNPTYKLPVAYQGIRDVRFGFKVQF